MSISTAAPVEAKTLRILPWIVGIAFFMQMLDATILNTALPAIAESFEVSPLRTHAVVIAYALIDASTPYVYILILFFFAGIFNSLQFTGMNTLTLVDLPDEHAAGGNSLLSAVMQLSIGLGVALAAAFLAVFTSAGKGALNALHYTFLALAALNALSALIFVWAGSAVTPRTRPLTE